MIGTAAAKQGALAPLVRARSTFARGCWGGRGRFSASATSSTSQPPNLLRTATQLMMKFLAFNRSIGHSYYTFISMYPGPVYIFIYLIYISHPSAKRKMIKNHLGLVVGRNRPSYNFNKDFHPEIIKFLQYCKFS